jgi:hypothetical protein
VLSAKNISEAVVAESHYVGYAVWDPGCVKHRVDDETGWREVAGETFASCECEGASFEFDSLNPSFCRVELDFADGVDLPRQTAVSSAKTVKVVGTYSGHPSSAGTAKPITWSNWVVDDDKLTGYGKGVKELYDKAIDDLVATMPNGGALTPPKKFCLTAEGIEEGKEIWFKTDGWYKKTPQVGRQPSSDAVIAKTFAGIGAEIWKCNYEHLKGNINTVEYEDGCIFYGYTAFGGQGVIDWIDSNCRAAYNSTSWRLMSFPTAHAGVKVSFCVSTELKVYNKSNTRTEETEGVKVCTTSSTPSGGGSATTEIAKNTVVDQRLRALDGVPLMVYNLKDFKNEVEPGKETVWEFESCGTPVEGYNVPKAVLNDSTCTWVVQGDGVSKITITVPKSRTVMLSMESGCLWGQVTEFVKGAQASVCEEKYLAYNKDGSFHEGYKKKEEHISGGAYVWQVVSLVKDAEISFEKPPGEDPSRVYID